jgi:hypothetical protein
MCRQQPAAALQPGHIRQGLPTSKGPTREVQTCMQDMASSEEQHPLNSSISMRLVAAATAPAGCSGAPLQFV